MMLYWGRNVLATMHRTKSLRAFLMYLSIAGIMALLLALYFIIRHRAFAFVDIGIDTFSYYYPAQMLHARQLHHGQPMSWSFHAGLGGFTGFSSNLIIWLNSLFPASWQLGLRLPTYLFRLLLAGGFMFGYLRKLRLEPSIAMVGALAYAYCGYAMVNGQWDTQGYVVPQMAAYLFFFECYFRDRKARYAILAGFIVATGQVFDTYTFSLLTVLYAATRPWLVSREDDAAPYLPSLLRYAGWAALGAMLAAVVLIPNLFYFLSSPRVSGDHSALHSILAESFELNTDKMIGSELAGLFGKGLLGTGSHYGGYLNWFAASGFYVGMLTLVVIPQLFGPHATRRERWMAGIGMALLLFYLLFPFIRFAVYGFGHRGFRLSTLWVSFGLLILGVAALQRIYASGAWKAGLVMAPIGIFFLAIIAAASFSSHANFTHLSLVCGFAAAYSALLWPKSDGKPRTPVTAIAIVLACELLVFALPAMVQRPTVSIDGHSRRGTGSYFDGTEKAIQWIRKHDQSGEFFRIAKTYRSIQLNSPMVLGYNGTSSYMFHGPSLTRFVDHMELHRTHPRTNYIGRMTKRRKIINLVGVKYVIAKRRSYDKTPGMKYLETVAGKRIYRNTEYRGVARLYRKTISEKRADKMSKRNRDKLVLDTIIASNPGKLRAMLAAAARHDSNVPAHDDNVELIMKSQVELEARVAAAKPAVLLIAMPFAKGWSARVDGKSTPMFRVDYGLTGLILPAGTHSISFHYLAPGRMLGAWLTLSAIIMLALLGAIRTIRKRTNRIKLVAAQHRR